MDLKILNIAQHVLEKNVGCWPEKTALILFSDDPNETERYTFREVESLVRRAASGLLATGEEAGTRVMLKLPNGIEFVSIFLGALAAGWVPLAASTMLTPRESEELLIRSEANWLVTTSVEDWSLDLPIVPQMITVSLGHFSNLNVPVRSFSSLLGSGFAPYASTDAEDPAFLIFTSGATGHPKGVLHAHRSLLGRKPMHAGWMGLGADDVILHAGQLNWTYTLGVGLLDPWSCGATAVLYKGNMPSARTWLSAMNTFDVTMFAAVPGVYRKILRELSCSSESSTFSTSTLRHGLVAGEALAPSLMKRWQETTQTPLYEALGMSEISTYISSGPLIPPKPGSPGRPQKGRRVAILSVEGDPEILPSGEIGYLGIHRSDPGLMLGYLTDEGVQFSDEVCRGEWFCGGDLASFDEDGYIQFHGRNDDVLTAMGYRISPLEVEQVLEAHVAVQEAALVQRQVRDGLQLLVAHVVPVEPEWEDKDDLLEWLSGRLAKYKQPHEIHFVSELPRTKNGKLKRSFLR